MNELRVDIKKCTKCGTCVRACVAGIVEFGEDGYPQMAPQRAARCIECGQCVLFCAVSADTLSCMDGMKLLPAKDIAMPSEEQALNLLKTRRSIRQYLERPLAHADFEKIFDAVSMAPTAVNKQPVRWAVTEDPEKTHELLGLMFEWLRSEIFRNPTSPVSLIGAAVLSKAKEGEDMVLRGAPHVAVAVVPKEHKWPEDGSIALTYLELAAHGMGIGCCWAGYLTMALRSSEKMRAFLGIGEDEHICGGQMIGFPAIRPSRQYPFRREVKINWVK